MSLDEYILKLRAAVDSFEKAFIEGQATNPDNWPLELDEAEWDEQFRSHWDMGEA